MNANSYTYAVFHGVYWSALFVYFMRYGEAERQFVMLSAWVFGVASVLHWILFRFHALSRVDSDNQG